MDGFKMALGGIILYQLIEISDKLDRLNEINSKLLTMESSLSNVTATLGHANMEISGSHSIFEQLNSIYTILLVIMDKIH